jgi:hypothetical protein
MMPNNEEDQEFLNKYIKLAARMAGFIKNKRGDCLYTVKIKGKGKGFYWSLSDKAFIWIDRGADLYWVDKVKKDARGRYCLFAPYTFGIGVLVMVPEDEIQWIGLN